LKRIRFTPEKEKVHPPTPQGGLFQGSLGGWVESGTDYKSAPAKEPATSNQQPVTSNKQQVFTSFVYG